MDDIFLNLLLLPQFPEEMPAEDRYRAACIGAVVLLSEEKDYSALAKAALSAVTPEISSRAFDALISAAKNGIEDAIRTIFYLAINESFPDAIHALRKFDFQDVSDGYNVAKYLILKNKSAIHRYDPNLSLLTRFFLESDVKTRMNLLTAATDIYAHWAMITAWLNAPEKRDDLLKNFGHFTEAEKALLCEYLSRDTSNLSADLFLRFEDDRLKSLCLKNDLHPSDLDQCALFYFLTEQWERYNESDSGYRLILRAYEQADATLKRRLILVSRRSGNSGWLRQTDAALLGHSRETSALSDWLPLIQSLDAQHLWASLPTFPAVLAASVFLDLQSQGFRPSNAEDCAFFNELSDILQGSALKLPLPVRFRANNSTGRMTSFAGGSKFIAAAYTDHRICFWNPDKPDNSGIIRLDKYIFNFLRFSPNGNILATATSDGTIGLFNLPDGRNLKWLRTPSATLCGCFIRNDSRRMVTLDSRGKGRIFAFPLGTELGSFDIGLDPCFRCAYDPLSDRICATDPSGMMKVFDFTQMRIVETLHIENRVSVIDSIIHEDCLHFLDGDGKYQCLNLLSGKYRVKDVRIDMTGRTRCLSMDNDGEIAALGTDNGGLSLFCAANGVHFSDLLTSENSAEIIGIHADKVFSSGNSGGEILIRDLSLFEWMTSAYSLNDLPGINRINQYAKEYPETALACKFLCALIRRRTRFDIEIESWTEE